jgi:hypothetical protein
MNSVDELIRAVHDITYRYGLIIQYLDSTEITLFSRFGLSQDVYIELYANIRKNKINLSLIISGSRVFGIDKEGGFYHAHPFENPISHVRCEPVGIEDFVIQSIGYLKTLDLL